MGDEAGGAPGVAPGVSDERLLVGLPALDRPEQDHRESAPQPVSPARRGMAPGRLAEKTGALFSAAIETEAARGTGFVLLPVFMAGGALAWFSAGSAPAASALWAGLAASAALALALREKPALFATCLALAAFLAGMVAADAETRWSRTQITGSAVATGVTGRVARIEHREDGRVRLTIDVLETARPALRYAPPRVRLTARQVPEALAAGDVINGYARLMPPSGPVRPGGYDFAFESWFDGIGAVGFFLGDPKRAEWAGMPSPASRIAAWTENIRLALAGRIRAQIGGPEGEIAAALIAGVRAGIPEEINEALRRTGLAHVLSISGLHMALVALSVMTALRSGFALFPAFASRHPTKKYGAALSLLACAAYLAISGIEVAALRSFIMLAVMLLALLADRSALTMRNLAFAALIVIAISPHEVMGPSFQMSFAATAALIGGYAAWSQYRERRPRRAPPRRGILVGFAQRIGYGMAALAMTSVLAGLATTIYGVYHFHRVSPWSLGANLLAMPVVSVLVMPWAVAAAVLMPFGLDGLPLWVMGRGIALMNAIAIWFSDRSPLDAVGAIPPSSVVAFTLALAASALPTTWLRLACLPLVAAGLLLVSLRTLPDVLISEDGRLVAVRLEDGRLAVNRPRPNGFTIDNWMMATAASEWLRPAKDAEAGGQGFSCGERACIADAGGGRVIVHTADAVLASAHCGIAALIVIDDATAKDPCAAASGTTVLTKRDLARRGSAEISFAGRSRAGPPAIIRHAIDEPYRPWHEHRQFSREARGLPPYERRPKQGGEGATTGGT